MVLGDDARLVEPVALVERHPAVVEELQHGAAGPSRAGPQIADAPAEVRLDGTLARRALAGQARRLQPRLQRLEEARHAHDHGRRRRLRHGHSVVEAGQRDVVLVDQRRVDPVALLQKPVPQEGQDVVAVAVGEQALDLGQRAVDAGDGDFEPLRGAGAARGELDRTDVRGRVAGMRRQRRCAVRSRVAGPVTHRGDVADAAAPQPVGGEQQPQAEVGDDALRVEAAGLEARRDAPELEDGKVEQHPLDPVAGHDPDPVPRPHPERVQPARHRDGLGVELGERERALLARVREVDAVPGVATRGRGDRVDHVSGRRGHAGVGLGVCGPLRHRCRGPRARAQVRRVRRRGRHRRT